MSFSCVLTAHAAWAEPVQLNAQAIRATLPGSVLKLDTPLRTVVPITFSADGYMSGDAGQLASVLGSQKDRGRWWVADDRVCYKWFRWFDAEQHCLAIKRDGQKVFWTQDSGETGTATLEEHRKPALVQVAIARDSDRSAYIPHQKSATDLSYDTTNIRPPVLVKLPTLAVRPRKKTVVVLTTAVVPPMATSNGGRYTERDAQIP
jgi:hypothetical protein